MIKLNSKKIFFFIIAILFIAIYIPTFQQLSQRYLATDTYYSHGFLIPFVAGFLIWKKRDVLKKFLPEEPSNAGLIFLIPGLILHLVGGVLLKINVVSYASIILVLLGLALYLFGRRITKEILFPIFFLIFMLPLPGVIIIAISFHMKILAAHIATLLVKTMGIPIVRDGSTILLPKDVLMVGDPCSGLRSLISLLALGAVFTQMVTGSRAKRATLFLATIPIALFSNVIRIIMLIIVAFIYGSEKATGAFHDFTGMLVFVFAFIGLILTMKALKCQFAQTT